MRWWIYSMHVEVMQSYTVSVAKCKERSHRVGHWLNHIKVNTTPIQWDNVNCIHIQLVQGRVLWIQQTFIALLRVFGEVTVTGGVGILHCCLSTKLQAIRISIQDQELFHQSRYKKMVMRVLQVVTFVAVKYFLQWSAILYIALRLTAIL
jgi:hypothetical protein